MDESGARARADGGSLRRLEPPLSRRVSPGLLYRTLRHLRSAQIAGQVRHRLRRWTERPEHFFRAAVPEAPACRWQPRSGFLPPGPQDNSAESLRAGRFCFLNRDEPLGFPPPWRTPDLPRLWEYNLHYFEFLWALPFDEARSLAEDWIAHHPLERGAVGWEPYPTSLRLMNWCALFFARDAAATQRDPVFRDALWRSIYLQTEWLSRHLEAMRVNNA